MFITWFVLVLISSLQHVLLCYNQFEDEFQRYIPTYMDMLQEVDAIAMDDSVEVICLLN